MDGLLNGATATLARPLGQGHLPGEMHTILEEIDFTREAAVGFEIAVDQRGAYVDARTGASIQPVVETFSRMKYGDLESVNFFAGHLTVTALRNEHFVAFCRRAAAHGRFTYIVSTAMFNVPSASNLLARAAADYLNVGLAAMGLPPVINAQQTRLTESALGYARKTVLERASAPVDGAGGVITIVPETFRGQSVIFLDDLFNSGYSANRTWPRLRKVHVAEIFSLFAARVDPQTVAATDGTIEYFLNNAVIDGSLESVAPMLKHGNFAVVQKLMKITFDPTITAQLPEFLQDIPTASILKLYVAAASNDYRRRYRGQFAPSMRVYESVLQERGVLDANGHVTALPVHPVVLQR